MIINWCNFFLIILWVSLFSFILTLNNLLNLLILSELIWITLYVYSSILATIYNSMFIFLIGLFLLGIATCESAIGLTLLILRMAIFNSINEYDVLNNQNNFLYKNKHILVINSKIKNERI
jgi:NADH:ubiquinone oxidoreductase subunit K